jgi:hypothetical protein
MKIKTASDHWRKKICDEKRNARKTGVSKILSNVI